MLKTKWQTWSDQIDTIGEGITAVVGLVLGGVFMVAIVYFICSVWVLVVTQ